MRIVFEIILKVIASIPSVIIGWMEFLIALILWEKYFVSDVSHFDAIWETNPYKRAVKQQDQLEDLVKEALHEDSLHHKQWYLEQIANRLEIDLENEDYEKGIVP